MKAMFIGDPRNDGDGPKVLTLQGVAFPKNEWVDPVPSALEGKLAGNSHFVTEEGNGDIAAALAAVEQVTSISPGLAEADEDAFRASILAAAFPDSAEPDPVMGEPAADVVEDPAPALTPAQVEALDRDGDGVAGGSNASDEKAALVAELEAMKVDFDKRLGVAKLKALIDEQKFLKGED